MVKDVVLKIVWVAIAVICWILYGIYTVPHLKSGVLPLWDLIVVVVETILLVVYSVAVIITLIKD